MYHIIMIWASPYENGTAYAINIHARPSSGDKCLVLDVKLYLLPYFVPAHKNSCTWMHCPSSIQHWLVTSEHAQSILLRLVRACTVLISLDTVVFNIQTIPVVVGMSVFCFLYFVCFIFLILTS